MYLLLLCTKKLYYYNWSGFLCIPLYLENLQINVPKIISNMFEMSADPSHVGDKEGKEVKKKFFKQETRISFSKSKSGLIQL